MASSPKVPRVSRHNIPSPSVTSNNSFPTPSPRQPTNPGSTLDVNKTVQEIIDALKTTSGLQHWDRVSADLPRLSEAYRFANMERLRDRSPLQDAPGPRLQTDLNATDHTLGGRLGSNGRGGEYQTGPSLNPMNGHLNGVGEQNPGLNEITLLRALKAYTYHPKEISFQRFTWLNVLNLLMYEDELMALDIDYSKNPGLVL